MIDIDHLTPDPWHPLTVSGNDKTRMQSWAHPDGCPARCRLGRILLAAREFGETFPAITASLPTGKYRLRWTARGIDVQHADGTDVPGQRPTPPAPVNLTDDQADALARAANEALGAYRHLDLCGCDQWPASCASGYTPGQWDTGAWYSAVPALLAAWERMRVAELETAARATAFSEAAAIAKQMIGISRWHRDTLVEVETRLNTAAWNATHAIRTAPPTPAADASADEWVRCSGLHCKRSERFTRATERGWEHGHMDTWQCPQCAANAEERRDLLGR